MLQYLSHSPGHARALRILTFSCCPRITVYDQFLNPVSSFSQVCTNDVRQIMLLMAIKSLDTAFTAVQECLLPNFLLDSGKCMPTVKSLVSASPGCSLCLVYLPAPEYFSPVGCHKMAFCSQIKEQKSLSCLPLASEMYRHSMALNSTCRRRNKLSDLKKFKFVFLRADCEPQSVIKWPISERPTADKELADSWLESRTWVLNFGLVPNPSWFRKLLTTINTLKEIELRKNFTVVRKSMYSSPWQYSSFVINFKRGRTG